MNYNPLAKRFLVLSFAVFSLFITLSSHAEEAENPERLVEDFYTWYFEANKGDTLAVHKDDIFHYVAQDTVKYIRGYNRCFDEDYFTKSGMGNIAWSNVKTTVLPAIWMSNDVYAVPVRFVPSYENYAYTVQVIVFVKQLKDGFRIVRVVDVVSVQ